MAHRFYESDRDAYLRMYSGLHFGPIALKLVDEETRSVAFMLGGVSKLHALQAVYDFANGDEVTRVTSQPTADSGSPRDPGTRAC